MFESHINEKIVNEIRDATNGNFVLGNKRFQEVIEMMLGRRVVKGKAGRPWK